MQWEWCAWCFLARGKSCTTSHAWPGLGVEIDEGTEAIAALRESVTD